MKIFAKKLILSIETTLRTLLFTKISLKSSGTSISEKIHYFIHNGGNGKIEVSLTRTHLVRIFAKLYSNKRSICFFLKNKTLTTIFLAQ